jgi:hypothetical protein
LFGIEAIQSLSKILKLALPDIQTFHGPVKIL